MKEEKDHRINKGGRPKIENPKEIKNILVGFMVNHYEKKQIDALFKKSSYNKKSDMLRDIVLKNELKVISLDENLTQEIGLLITQSKKIGNNLNTLLALFYKKNKTYLTHDDIKKIHINLEDINTLFKKIDSKI